MEIVADWRDVPRHPNSEREEQFLYCPSYVKGERLMGHYFKRDNIYEWLVLENYYSGPLKEPIQRTASSSDEAKSQVHNYCFAKSSSENM